MKIILSLILLLSLFNLTAVVCGAESLSDELADDFAMYEEDDHGISDPLEPLNRIFFQFNDKFFTYVLNPVAKTYAKALPEEVRSSVNNAFVNLLTPVRLVNNLLQGKFKASGNELVRFVINSTAGAGGFGDPAKTVFNIDISREDLGQTLGTYGIGEGIYICWPFLGPSNIRDTVGLVGDTFLNPLTYLTYNDTQTGLAVYAGQKVNSTSLVLGEYEQFIESAFDPYVAMRDFYSQTRRSKIKDEEESKNQSLKGKGKKLFMMSSTDLKNRYLGVVGRKYFIQVGAYVDLAKVHKLSERLDLLQKNPLVVEYDRSDYKFFGVLVPGGKSFATAKAEEQELIEAGFPETVVVAR